MAEERETLCAINRVLPSFSEYIRVVLKEERLSDKAEAWRMKYEASIVALERAVEIKEPEPSTLIPPEGSGIVLPPSALHDTTTDVDHTQASEVLIDCNGYLLRRDDKLRWHRCWCKIDLRNFSVYTTMERDQMISSYPVERIITQFDSEISKFCDKQHCFMVGNRASVAEGESESKDSKTLEKIYFAAYSEAEFGGWKSAFAAATSRQPSIIDSSLAPCGPLLLPQAPSETQAIESEQALFNKQQLPLPLLPTVNEDEASDSIVYEELDQLVLQLDETMRATAQTMGQLGQGAKPRVKKEKVLMRQNASLKGKSLSQKGSIDEMGKEVSLSSPLYKKNANGSWKKRWCTLKGYVFNYYKSLEDKKGHQYLVLGATLEAVEDPKKQYAFRLACKGVPEMWFAAETKEKLDEWISCLTKTALMTVGADCDKSILGLSSRDSHPVISDADTSGGIYNIPRSVSDAGTYDVPPKKRTVIKDASQALPPPPDRDSLYNVPRSLLLSQSSVATMQDESPVNPFDLYDVPRSVLLQYNLADEEGIYDEPPDIGDLEIYDYPPDAAADSGESGYCGSVRSSMISLDETGSLSSWGADQAWKSSTLPPVPTSARPSIQCYRNSTLGGFYDVPRHLMADASLQLPHEDAGNLTDSASANQFNQCTMTGFLFKREKFMHWTKMYCVIRNCFLECQKVQNGGTANPVIKLFIPGSQVSPDPDARKSYAFRLKHPRRTGVLQFAAQGESDYKDWLCALQAATSIEVKPADTVDEIRITDLEQNKRWTSLEKGVTKPPEENVLSVRRNTVSEGSTEEGNTDTLRRKKFQWMKWNQNRKQLSSTDLQAGKQPATTLTERSVSLMSLDSLLGGGTPSLVRAHKSVSSMGQESFQGYLKVQRKGADSLWVRYWCVLKDKVISCFIGQNDLTLTLSVPLGGSTILEANGHRKYSFEISHLESGQCLYFAAECKEDYDGWFAEIITGAQQVQLQDSSSPAMYLHPKTSGAGNQQSSELSTTGSDGIFSSPSAVFPPSVSSIQHKGELLRLSNTGEWKKYHCILRDGGLHIHYTVFDKTPIFVIALQGCILECSDSSVSGKYVFTITTSFGKCHTFDALSELDLHKWMQALHAYCQMGPPPSPVLQQGTVDRRGSSPVTMRPKHTTSKSNKLKDTDLVSYIPASKLTNASYSGVAELQFGTGPWQKFWAVLHLQCLYIYQAKSAQSTVKTIVLPGYKISVAGQLVKKPFVITLTHSCVLPTNLAASDQAEMDAWFSALDQASRLETQETERSSTVSRELTEKVPSAIESEGGASHGKLKETALESPVEMQHSSSLLEKKEAIIHRYEKRIRRTHKVASQTEQSLKQQQSQLQTVKDELNRCIAKFEEKVHSGDNQALLKIKDAEVRIQQVAKILPYLSKYIQFNKKAELQTVAILRESCMVELNKLENGTSKLYSDDGMQSVTASDSRQIKVLSSVGNYARVEFLPSKSPQQQLKSVDYAKLDKTLLASNSKSNESAKPSVSTQQKEPHSSS